MPVMLSPCLVMTHFCHKRQERHVPRTLDGDRQPALMLGAHTGLPARANLATLIDETA